jgi:hypothetical protein
MDGDGSYSIISFREFLSNNRNLTSEMIDYILSIWNNRDLALMNIKSDDGCKRRYANLVLKRLKYST